MARNRARILAAALSVYREHAGPAANEEIIAAAGIGMSTFYRHFPNRNDLHRALLDHLAAPATDIAADADATEDPWTAFATVFRNGCVLDGADLALFQTLAATSPELAQHAASLTEHIVAPTLHRAKRAGLLADHLDADTVVDLMSAAHAAADPRRRHDRAEVLLAGLRATCESAVNRGCAKRL
ncbi:TetR family transcriptional regulator [Nocardia thailandica]|uniref:TetR family transcriptional regulator n=1 Tax=Nocardia thailandica TaxID=257275 RepID=UPI0006946814|nr:TetR family transcriptional regulator [Nocardia thailandica]